MRTPNSSPRGFSLIELVGVIAMTSMLMMVAVALLHSLLEWSRGSTAASAHTAAADRLERQLRPQLQQATDIEANGPLLRVVVGDETAAWKLTGSACELSVATPDGPRFDRFAIGPYEAWQTEADGHFVRVELEPPPGTHGLPVRFVVARTTLPPGGEP